MDIEKVNLQYTEAEGPDGYFRQLVFWISGKESINQVKENQKVLGEVDRASQAGKLVTRMVKENLGHRLYFREGSYMRPRNLLRPSLCSCVWHHITMSS